MNGTILHLDRFLYRRNILGLQKFTGTQEYVSDAILFIFSNNMSAHEKEASRYIYIIV
jgi:hypothetical protein